MARFTQDGLDETFGEQWRPDQQDPTGLTDPTQAQLGDIFNDSGQGGTVSTEPVGSPELFPDTGIGGAGPGIDYGNTPQIGWLHYGDTTQSPTGGTGGGDEDRVGWLQGLLGGGTSYQDAIKQYNSRYNPDANSQAAYYSINGHNVIGLPNGVGGPYGGYFTDEGGWHFVPRTEVPGGGGGGGGTGATGGTGGTGGAGGNVKDVLSQFLMSLMGGLRGRQDPNSGLRSDLTNRFLSLADKYSAPVDENDPIINANTQAYHGVNARKLNDLRERYAERAYAEGVPTGAFDAAIGNAEQAQGRDEAQFGAGLRTNELSNRRAALANILSQAGAYLSDQDKMALQDKLGTLDAALGFNSAENSAGLGEESLANQRTAMENQDTQFYDKLASDMSGQSNSLDEVLLALGLK